MTAEFTKYGEGGAWQIINQIEEHQEKQRLKSAAMTEATVAMIGHGTQVFGRWIVPLEYELTPAISLNIDLESNDEVDSPQEIENFQLRFWFKQKNMWNSVAGKMGKGSSDISRYGVKNFNGEEASLADLRQIVSCLEFLQAKKQEQKEAQATNSTAQPAQL